MESPDEVCQSNVAGCDASSWSSLVRRSVEAWPEQARDTHPLAKSCLETFSSLNDFLHPSPSPMFWFFQRREAFLRQKSMTKWSPDRLDDYILLPALEGFVTRRECLFVSHFWRSRDNPDPGGEYLRLLQSDLEKQEWSHIWVDWTCLPQLPRTEAEGAYFRLGLQTMPAIIQNCGFAWYYPPFEPRLWILYEVAEYILTSTGDILVTPDLKAFVDHVDEMLHVGVRATLDKHGCRCSYDRDKEFLTAWLDLLVLLRKLFNNLVELRLMMGHLTWFPSVSKIVMNTANSQVELYRFEGRLSLDGEVYMFTPFPRWEDGKYSSYLPKPPSKQVAPGGCTVCGKQEGLLWCGRCVGEQYCGKEHQREDWRRHKASCK